MNLPAFTLRTEPLRRKFYRKVGFSEFSSLNRTLAEISLAVSRL